MSRTLFLASQSPRRAALVKLLGVGPIEIRPADLHEAMEPDQSPAENVCRLALHKAEHIAEQLAGEEGIVLGADTTVVVNGEILEKPIDAADAERMLSVLSGETHTVYTGVALVDIKTHRQVSF